MFVFRFITLLSLLFISNNSFARYVKNSKELLICYSLESLILKSGNDCFVFNNYSVFYKIHSYDSLDVFHIKFYTKDGSEKFGFVQKSKALQYSVNQ